jgi:hypothetical protein
MRDVKIALAALGLTLLALSGCDQPAPVAPEGGSAGDETTVRRGTERDLDPALCALTRRDFTLKSTNDYFPLRPGSSWTLRGTEDGNAVELRVDVLKKTVDVGGVTTRVVEERHYENGQLIEYSRNFFAATSEGTICYFGEDVDIYENGRVVAHTGAWRADAPGNRPGIYIPAEPQVGMTYFMEGAPRVAEDRAEIIGKRVRTRVPAGTFKSTIQIRETALDGDESVKIFARGVGIVVDGPLELVRYRIGGGGREDDDQEDEEDEG